MSDTPHPAPDVTLDLTGVTCPGPILGAKRVVDDLAEGQVLLLLSDCPGTRDDLFSWAESTGHRVLSADRRSDGATAYYVQRGRVERIVPQVVLDMRGVVCPGPIVEAKRLLNGMRPGEVLKLISDCPGTRADIQEWTRITGLELVDTVALGAHAHEFFVRKH